MNRKPIPHSPYSMGPPGDLFTSPMSRPRHPNSPRFHQQFVPHFTGPGTPGQNPCWTPPPRPSRSPHHSGPSPRPDFNGSGYSPRHPSNSYSPGQNSFDRSGPSPNSYQPGGRNNTSSDWGCNSRGRYGFNKDRFSPRGAGPDCNPGGSDDIRQYYNPSMLRDPWERMQAIPASNASCTSTTT